MEAQDLGLEDIKMCEIIWKQGWGFVNAEDGVWWGPYQCLVWGLSGMVCGELVRAWMEAEELMVSKDIHD